MFSLALTAAGFPKTALKPTKRFISVSRPFGQTGFADRKKALLSFSGFALPSQPREISIKDIVIKNMP